MVKNKVEEKIMNKLIVLLLLVSTVIGMAMPSLAEDAGTRQKPMEKIQWPLL